MKFRAGHLPARVLAFLEANPDEELTIEQVATKFSATHWTVRNALRRLMLSGKIEDVRVVRLPSKGRARE